MITFDYFQNCNECFQLLIILNNLKQAGLTSQQYWLLLITDYTDYGHTFRILHHLN